jgi:hypothetical protein
MRRVLLESSLCEHYFQSLQHTLIYIFHRYVCVSADENWMAGDGLATVCVLRCSLMSLFVANPENGKYKEDMSGLHPQFSD